MDGMDVVQYLEKEGRRLDGRVPGIGVLEDPSQKERGSSYFLTPQADANTPPSNIAT